MPDPVEAATQQASAALNDAGERLDAELQALRADVARIAASVADPVRLRAASAGVGSARHARRTSDGSGPGVAGLERVIDRNPLTAITASLLVGIIVGVVTRRR